MGSARRTAWYRLLLLPAVALSAPTPRAALHALGRLGAETDPAAPVVAALSLLAWAGAAWLAVLVLAARAELLPGRVGRGSGWLLRVLAPGAVRALVRVAVGAGACVTVLSGPAAHADDRLPTSLDWPTTSATSPAQATPTTTSPATPTKSPDARRAAPSLVRPAVEHPRPVRGPAGAPGVEVRAGDSLWSIAAHRLGGRPSARRIAQEWPRWWAANRAVLGDDPDLIHPGTHLTAPGSAAAGTHPAPPVTQEKP